MNIELYNFSKRINSTKQPATSGTVKAVSLKAPTDMYHPIVTISGNEFNYNYAKFNGLYFYVTPTSLRDGIMQLDLTLDPYASFKSEILATTAFVKYSASEHDSSVIDSRLQQTSDTSYYTSSGSAIYTTPDNGRFVLQCVGVGQGAHTLTGINAAYAMAAIQLKGLSDEFISGTISLDKLLQYFGSAWDCIVDCKLFPLSITDFPTGTSTNIMLGDYQCSTLGYPITDRMINDTDTITIPWHFSDFRNLNPYTEMSILLPYIGSIPLNPADWIGESAIEVSRTIDILTGAVSYTLAPASGSTVKILSTYTGNIASSIPVSTYKTDTSKVFGSLIQEASSALSGDILGTASGLLNFAANAFKMSPSMVGGYGGASGFFNTAIQINLICHNTNVTPASVNSVMGRPLFASKTLSSLSGYVETFNASVAAACPDNILSTINSALDGGLYIE